VTSLGQVGYPRIRGADQRGTGPHPGWREEGADPRGADPRPRLGLGLADLGDRLGSNPAGAGLPGVTRPRPASISSDLGGDRAAIHQILAEAVAEPRGRDSGFLSELRRLKHQPRSGQRAWRDRPQRARKQDGGKQQRSSEHLSLSGALRGGPLTVGQA
jgi:hypothetical protein